LGGTPKNDPLQRNEKNPIHATPPALCHPIVACRRSTIESTGLSRLDGWLQAEDQADGSSLFSRQISVLALAANNTPPGLFPRTIRRRSERYRWQAFRQKWRAARPPFVAAVPQQVVAVAILNRISSAPWRKSRQRGARSGLYSTRALFRRS